MLNPAQLKPEDLVIGGRYLHVNGLFIRHIDAIEGGTVIYHDQYGHGRCGKRAFLKVCPAVASDGDAAQAEGGAFIVFEFNLTAYRGAP